ncbi:hypothetical protein Fmac_005005 [Flemingia macrophylla]|uniref:DNA polymerase delta subunit 4 n=1 Tax=Flemingia macrophylla TaxID=520843 RepID=A0ABD1N6M3_9FABA
MATVSGNMKGFYRQKKNAITKKSSNKSPINAATLGSVAAQTPAHAGSPDLEDEHKASEVVLRQFDMNMAYGPCIGITRLARWERALRLGLNPPQEIETLLKSGKVQAESLWDGCI